MTSSLVFYPHKNQNQNHNLTFIMTRNATALKKKSLALHNVNYYGKFTAARAFHFNTLLQNWFNFNNYNILQRASAPELSGERNRPSEMAGPGTVIDNGHAQDQKD